MGAFPCFRRHTESQNQETCQSRVDGHRKRMAEKIPGDIAELPPAQDDEVERIMQKSGHKQDEPLHDQAVHHGPLGKVADTKSGQGFAQRIEAEMGWRIDILKPAGCEAKHCSAELSL